MTSPTHTAAPITDLFRLERQRDLLLEYIAHKAILPPDVVFKYSSHEFTARKDEPVMVQVHLRLYSGGTYRETSVEFTLEELKLFQGRRPPSGTNVPSTAPKSSPVSAPVTVVDQVSWTSNRESLFKNAMDLERDARRYVSMQLIDGNRQMTCRCISGRHAEALCDHLQFVYATSWERDKLLDPSGSGGARRINLPLGMGQVYCEFEALILNETGTIAYQVPDRTGYVRIGAISNVENQLLSKLAEAASPFPLLVNHVILGPSEGTIKAIRYVEGMLRDTDQYKKLVALSPSDASRDAFAQANMICKRNHSGESGRKLVAEFIAGLRAANRHRDAWMIACTYTLFMSELCLPCWKATSAASNVPVF